MQRKSGLSAPHPFAIFLPDSKLMLWMAGGTAKSYALPKTDL